jgi:hypothetical protein
MFSPKEVKPAASMTLEVQIVDWQASKSWRGGTKTDWF